MTATRLEPHGPATATVLSTDSDPSATGVTAIQSSAKHPTGCVPSINWPLPCYLLNYLYSFLNNKGAVAGVFTVVGLLGLALLIAIVTNVIRRRRAKKFDDEVANAAAAAYADTDRPGRRVLRVMSHIQVQPSPAPAKESAIASGRPRLAGSQEFFTR